MAFDPDSYLKHFGVDPTNMSDDDKKSRIRQILSTPAVTAVRNQTAQGQPGQAGGQPKTFMEGLTPEDQSTIRNAVSQNPVESGLYSGAGNVVNSALFGAGNYVVGADKYLRDKLAGNDTPFKYDLNYARAQQEEADKAHPTIASLGTGAGTIASLGLPLGLIGKGIGKAVEAAPFLGKLAGKAATSALGENVLGGAAQGLGSELSSGYGTSEGPSPLSALLEGGAAGAVGHGLGNLVSNAGKYGKKFAQWLSYRRMEPQDVDRYLENASAVKNAMPIQAHEPGQSGQIDRLGQAMQGLDQDVSKMSGNAFDVLGKTTPTIPKASLLESFDNMLASKPHDLTEDYSKWENDLTKAKNRIANYPADEIPSDALKRTIQGYDKDINYENRAMGAHPEAMANARQAIDVVLKKYNPYYAEAMAPLSEAMQAKDALQTAGVGRSDADSKRFLESLGKDKAANAKEEQARGALSFLDKNYGSGTENQFSEDAKNAMLKHKLEARRGEGSEEVNTGFITGTVGGEVLDKAAEHLYRMNGDEPPEWVGYAKLLGAPIMAASRIRKHEGGALAMGALNIYRGISKIMDPQKQALLLKAAKQGPTQLINVFNEMKERTPEINQIEAGQNASST